MIFLAFSTKFNIKGRYFQLIKIARVIQEHINRQACNRERFYLTQREHEFGWLLLFEFVFVAYYHYNLQNINLLPSACLNLTALK